jgi:actin-like ATPase involved in cell morphogenesis
VGYDLGVDLGTTFVAAALCRNGRTEMCALGNQRLVTPSVAYLSENSTLLLGEAAERHAISNPARVAREFKRRLGDPTPVVLGGVPYQVTTLMAALLRDVLAKVTAVEGAVPDRVALTHPANWGPYRRELFQEIPHLAGLSSRHTLTEPEAAAAYYATSRHVDVGDTIAVYDLGGGTFDATVLRRTREGIELLGDPEGIERLGGIDFDEAIVQWANHKYSGELGGLDRSDPQIVMALAKFRQECALAKEALSTDTTTTIPVLMPHNHFQAELTRAEFEGMIRAPIESTIGTLIRAVHSAQVQVSDLSAVLLVGGSSRIPLVARMISEVLGRPTVVDAHPKHAVALGAARMLTTRSAMTSLPPLAAAHTTAETPRPETPRAETPRAETPRAETLTTEALPDEPLPAATTGPPATTPTSDPPAVAAPVAAPVPAPVPAPVVTPLIRPPAVPEQAPATEPFAGSADAVQPIVTVPGNWHHPVEATRYDVPAPATLDRPPGLAPSPGPNGFGPGRLTGPARTRSDPAPRSQPRSGSRP